MNDTIAAISTTMGVGAISIIRVSGDASINIVNSIFSGDLNKVDSHTINYGYIIDKNQKVDEVLVSVMKAPKTYTTEDIVEINCHGGISTTNKVFLSHKIALNRNDCISSIDVSLLQINIFCAIGNWSNLSKNKYKINSSFDIPSHFFRYIPFSFSFSFPLVSVISFSYYII